MTEEIKHYAVITNEGKHLIEAAYNNNQKVEIVEMAIGDSNGEYVKPDVTFTQLVNELGRHNIHEANVEPHFIHAIVYVSSEKFAGQIIREFSLIDADGNTIVYAAYPDSLVPDTATADYIQLEIECVADLDNTQAVSITVNPIYPHAKENEAGIARIATAEQVETGESDEVIVTPKKLKEKTAIDQDIDDESTSKKLIELPQFWRALQPSRLIDKLWLGLAAKIFPVGAFIPWFTDEAPEGFAIGKGQAYDKAIFTELAKVFPDGVIPDMRGCGVIGKEDGETIGAYEEGQVKQHGHPGSSVSSANLGTKTSASKSTPYLSNVQVTTTDGNRDNMTIPSSGWSGYQVKGGASGSAWATRYYNKLLSHNHTLAIGSHAHTVAIALFGALKNTINHRKVNWIVRMA